MPSSRPSPVAWVCVLLVLAGCGSGPTPPPGPPAPVKLSLHDKVEAVDLCLAKDGLHFAFTDRETHSKALALYVRSSRDLGRTWSAPEALSPAEGELDAGVPRLLADPAGRLYAIYKIVPHATLLDGPGGYSPGRLVYRCRTGSAWSEPIQLGDGTSTYSWFAAPGPDGRVHVVFSQMTPDAKAAASYLNSAWANLVQQVVLDGTTVSAPRALTTPRRVPGPDEVKAMVAAGKFVSYLEQSPDRDGLINLRGLIGPDGTPRFLAEDHGVHKDGSQVGGKRILYFDGGAFHPLHEYDRFETYNNFQNPPTLLADPRGGLHMLRAPEKPYPPTAVVDVPLDGPRPGPPVPALGTRSGAGAVQSWRAHALPGGKMAVSAALTEKGGYSADDLELYLAIHDGTGWSPPICLTKNAERKTSSSVDTTARDRVATVTHYEPRTAALALAPDGRPLVAMITVESTLLGLSSLETHAGRTLDVHGGARIESPAAYFLAP